MQKYAAGVEIHDPAALSGGLVLLVRLKVARWRLERRRQ